MLDYNDILDKAKAFRVARHLAATFPDRYQLDTNLVPVKNGHVFLWSLAEINDYGELTMHSRSSLYNAYGLYSPDADQFGIGTWYEAPKTRRKA